MLSSIIEYLETEDFTFKCEYECPQYQLIIEVGDDKNTEMQVFNSPTSEGVAHNVKVNNKIIISSEDVKEVINVIQTTSDIIYLVNKKDVIHETLEGTNLNMHEYITKRVEQEIECLFKEFHEKYNTKSGDITPKQQFNLDAYTAELISVMHEQVKQNL
jgi:hypothetical protein